MEPVPSVSLVRGVRGYAEWYIEEWARAVAENGPIAPPAYIESLRPLVLRWTMLTTRGVLRVRCVVEVVPAGRVPVLRVTVEPGAPVFTTPCAYAVGMPVAAAVGDRRRTVAYLAPLGKTAELAERLMGEAQLLDPRLARWSLYDGLVCRTPAGLIIGTEWCPEGDSLGETRGYLEEEWHGETWRVKKPVELRALLAPPLSSPQQASL